MRHVHSKRLALILALLACLAGARAAAGGQLCVVTRANHSKPHVACVFRYADAQGVWLHFRPAGRSVQKVLGRPVPGVLDGHDFQADLNHLIAFHVDDAKLREAQKLAEARFATGTMYELYERDCVTLAVAVCRACGLSVKWDHFTPKTLFSYLAEHNDSAERVFNLDRQKHAGYVPPWARPAQNATP